MQVDQVVQFVVENREVLITFAVSLVAVVKLTAWGKAQTVALDAVVGVIERLCARHVKAGVSVAETDLSSAAKDALRDAVARVDTKKTPIGAVLRILREVFRGI